jgi:hypothetical protein
VSAARSRLTAEDVAVYIFIGERMAKRDSLARCANMAYYGRDSEITMAEREVGKAIDAEYMARK